MSIVASSDSNSTLGTVLRRAKSVSIAVPASRKARAKLLADARAVHGFDLSDDERAARIRNSVRR